MSQFSNAGALALASCPPAPIANGFPMQDAVAARGYQLTGGIQGGPSQTREVPWSFYHRQNFPAVGTRTLRFFNAAYSKGVTNMSVAGTIPANTFFCLEAIRFDFMYGFDVNGSRVTVVDTLAHAIESAISGGNAGAVATDTLVSAQWKAQEKIRELLEQGVITFSVNQRPVFERFALTSFPSGKGVAGFMTSDTGATLTAQASVSHIAGQISNGQPHRANALVFPTRFPMPAGATFDVTVDWLALVDFTATGSVLGPLVNADLTSAAAAGAIMCELEGILIQPGSF